MSEWLCLCFSKNVMRRSSITALVVGAILTVINHGDAIIHGQVNPGLLLQVALTLLVPYMVSTISRVSTIYGMRKEMKKSLIPSSDVQ